MAPVIRTVSGMGIYHDRVLPHLIDKVCGMKDLRPLRERACSGLEGRVIEIGFGSGLNVGLYPDEVESVSAVEPSDVAWKIAAKRVRQSTVPIDRNGLDGEHLPFADNSFDSALSTFTMCTIPHLPLALSELRRVLKPGGSLHFVEHGLAPDEGVQRWQRRLDPIEKRVAGGCHFSREIVRSLEQAGFTVKDVDVFYQPGGPKFAGALSLGSAVSD